MKNLKSLEVEALKISEIERINGGSEFTDAIWRGLGRFIGGVLRGAEVREASGSYGVVGAHL
jgi:hypothetical protein